MWPFGASLTSHTSLYPRGLRRLPPHGHSSRALPLLAIKVEPPELPAPTPAMEDVLDPDLAARALGQFLVSPEPHDLYEIVMCKLVDSAVMSSSSPLSVCNLPTPSLSPVGDGDEYLSEWFDHRSDADDREDEHDSDGCSGEELSPPPLPATGMSELKVDPSLDQPHYGQGAADQDDKANMPTKGEDSERLRKRQRLYEKKYRNRKKVELKGLRKEWLELETQLLMARRKRLAETVVTLRHHTLRALKARAPARNRAELLRRCLLLARLERALVLDRMALSALGAFDQVARIREYTDKSELRSRREWQHSTSKIFGSHASQAPHRPLPLHFTW